jgi:hypothetical protein
MDQQTQLTLMILREELQLQTKAITENIRTELANMIDEKLKPVIEENKQLKIEIENIKAKMEKETRRNNLVLHGLPEKETDNVELLELVVETLNTLSENAGIDNWDKWEISGVRRLGKKGGKSIRPVLISVTLLWRKILILKNKKKFPKDIYATEDYPKEILDKRRGLKSQLEEERKKGKIAYILYDKLVVKEPINEKRKRSPSGSPSTSHATQHYPTNNKPRKINKIDAFTYTKPKASLNKDHNNI